MEVAMWTILGVLIAGQFGLWAMLLRVNNGLRKELSGITERLAKVEARLDRIETRLDKMEVRLDKIEEHIRKHS